MTRVLVTGAAGYIGSLLCQRLLRDGFKVMGMDTFLYQNEQAMLHLLGDSNFTLIEHDVRNLQGMRSFIRQADVVMPLAGIVGAPVCDRAPRWAWSVNRDAVAGLVRELSSSQRVVYPNTNSGYGQTDGKNQVTEDDPLTPVSIYGQSKVEAEKTVLDHPLGVSLRLATVFGPSPRMRFDLMVNDFTQVLARGGTLWIYEPHFKRNFVHVRDVARAFVHMACDYRLTGAFNVGLPDANLSKLDLAHAIASCLNIDPACVRIGEGQDPDKRNYLVSNDKLLATGFTFHHSLAQGVRDVAQMIWLLMLTPLQLEKMGNV